MATSEQIDQLISAVLVQPQAIYDLIELYLDSETTEQQRADIRGKIQLIQGQIRYQNLDQHTLEERVRIYLAKLSMFDGQENVDIDWRDASMSYDRFIKTVVDPAIRKKIPILKSIREISAISARGGRARIASFEETYRDRLQKIQKEEAQRFQQAKLNNQLEQKPTQLPPKAKDSKQVQPSRFSQNINLDLPHRHWVSPELRFGIATIFISIMAIIVISEGEDPRTVIFISMIFLAIVAVLSWTFYNRDW